MSSLSRELVFLVLQFLDEEKFKQTVHKLEKESGLFFNLKYFEDAVTNGEWDEVEKYLSGFTKVDDNRYSMKIFFEIRKQKYLEALDKNEYGAALEVLRKDLKVFSSFNEDLFKEITLLLTLTNFRENEQLSKYGDTKSARAIMFEELKKLIEANPLFRDKLQFPSLKNSRLRTLINQSLNWQHQLCKSPNSNPDIKTLFVDHTCGQPNGARVPSPVTNQLMGSMPKPFQPALAALTSSLGGWMANTSSMPHPAISGGPIGTNADSEHLLRRTRPSGISEEVNNLPNNILSDTYPGSSHSHASYSSYDLPKTVVANLNQGSAVKSMDFHPVQQMMLLVGTNIGDISVWEVGSRDRLAFKNFKVWNLGACSMTLQASLANEYTVSVNRVIWSPDGTLFGVAYSKHIVHIYSFDGSDDLRNHLEIDAHVGNVSDLAFSHPNKQLCIITCGMKCLLDYLEGKKSGEGCGEEVVKVFDLKGGFDWCRIHCLMMRECRRLEDGLPIYAFRQEILRQIHCQKIMVMIGETGSGKSTQLAQFLADSGVGGSKSIICTQPRKLAAMSLAERVREECYGCYRDTSIIYYPAFSSAQKYDSQVIYTTDHCLLQHYMNDKRLSRISCIIVDEAHERSLNTDLLLALLKQLLQQRLDLRLIIMSATIDANQLAEYFFGCGTFHVVGRNFPVDIRYVPCVAEGTSPCGNVASYVSDVVRMVAEIHRMEKEGTILAFLTSQTEVEWACEKFQSPSAVALALHGKLTNEDQARVFLDYPEKRKVIFTTNLAETSLTIPGVKHVVDSGMVKECRFEPSTGMNVLKVCRISQSSANQRAGRAGRTDPGRCYRLYSEDDFGLMPLQQEPEIRRVHLGIAVLKILALGINNVQTFDFVDAPSATAIDMAIRNLIQLGAVTSNNDFYVLTENGRDMVRLGIEPRLGKLILNCFHHHLGREGLVLTAVMTNASSIFCRIGTEEDKLKSDRLKVQFCHGDGDLFTLLSVYKEWESVPREKKNSWCWDNSINAKSMRRCQEMVQELENCLKNELNIIIPTYWLWNPLVQTVHDRTLKKVILSSLSENVAIYSGYDQFGYEVALTRKNVRLHPSCSLLTFSERPNWVVLGEILSINNQYLVCVTAIDIESLYNLCPPPLFDVSEIATRKLQVRVLTGCGSTLLKKFCGKSNNSLLNLVSRIKIACGNERIGVDVNFDHNEVRLFSSSQDIEKVFSFTNDALEYERKGLQNECLEKCLYHGGHGVSPSVALFGAGAEIKHLELERRYLTIDVSHSDVNAIDDKELLMFLERNTSGSICAVHKFGSGQASEDKEKWGRVTFLTPDAAKKATELNQVDFLGSLLNVVPARSSYGGDHKLFSFPAVKAKVYWPRKCSRGTGIVKCDIQDVACIVNDFSTLIIGGNYVWCGASMKFPDSVVISRLDKELSEAEILEVLRTATNRKILDFFLIRGEAVEDPPCDALEGALLREITPFMPKRNSHGNYVHIQVFPPELKDTYMRAIITFDGSLHLEAAKALEQIEGKVLPGCCSWQKIKCQQLFHSFVSCPSSVYSVIREQLNSLLSSFRRRQGVECNLDRNENGSYRVKISANATKTVAELRQPLEQLMRGKTVDHPGLVPTVLQLLFSKDGMILMKSIQRETGTYILFDRQSLSIRVFGSSEKIDVAQLELVQSLLTLHESKQLEIHLRGGVLPPDLMKKVVKKFGPDLHGLKEKLPEAEFKLNTRHHVISIQGSKHVKQKVEEMIYEIAQTSGTQKIDTEAACPICLCEVEDCYRLEGCGHEFCRLCLVEQCESAVKSQDSFPMRCTYKGCGALILIADFRFLLSNEKLEELFRASLGAFVAASGGTFRFCPSPDCPNVYQVADPGSAGTPFMCGACSVETCTKCHLEYHPYLSCERYKEFKEDPDSSLKEWCKGKTQVKECPLCAFTIEKVDGCNHVECRCGGHICWACLESFSSSDDCYGHLRSVHLAII